MKRILFIAALVLLMTGITEATMTYGGTYYRQHLQGALSGSTSGDPLYLFINEVETSLEGGGGVDSLIFTPGTAPTTASEGEVYYDSASNGLLLYTGSSWVTIDTAGASSLDTAYNTGAAITVDGDAVTLTTGSSDNNVVLALVQNESDNDNDALTITMGSGATGRGILINSQTGGTDIAGDNWSVAQTGVITSVSTVVGASGLVGTQSDILNNETNNTWTFDSDTATTEDFSIGLGANTNIITFSSASGAVTLELGALDDVNGVGNIYFDSAASQITLAANQAADDLLIQVTGAQNASLDLRSAGTGTDAIKVYASAGGIDVDGTNSTMTFTNTANGDTDDFTIEVAGTHDSSLILQSAGTGGDALSLITSNAAGDIKINSGDVIDIDAVDDIQVDISGAGKNFDLDSAAGSVYLDAGEADAAAITIIASATAGGIDIDSGTAGIAIDSTGAVSVDAAAASNVTVATNATDENLTLSVTGATASSLILASAGTGTDAVDMDASAGGIDIDSALDVAIDLSGAGSNFDVDSAAGSVYLDGGEAAANAIVITASATAGGIDIDSGTAGIAVDSTGKISIDGADDMNFTLTSSTDAEDLTIQVDGDDNCSIILDSDGTGADAIKINASNAAGGLDIDAGTNGINMTATGGDITVTNTTAKDIIIDAQAGRVLITGTESAADAIILTADGTNGEIAMTAGTGGIDIDAASGDIKLDVAGNANDDITLTNTNGTGAGAIAFVATAGGITAKVADGKQLKIGNAALDAYLLVNASATAADEDVELVNTSGTDNAAIALTATAGGITAKVADSKQLNLGNASTDTYVRIAPSATAASEVIQVVNSAGTDDAAIALTATAGGITAKVADEKNLTMGNTAGDAYVIVAASATAANEDVRIVNTNGTNAKAIEILASAGGVAIEGADEKAIYIGNDAKDAYVEIGASATAADEDVRIINTNGTDEGAIVLTATAGGIDLNAASGKDIAMAAGQIAAVAAHNTADAILLHADAGASQTIRLLNDEGTSVTEDAGAIQLSASAGGIQIQSDGDLDDAVVIRADGGTTAEMTIHNDRGTSESSIEIISDDGGIDITCATAKNMDLTGGQITLLSNEAAASAIALTTNTGAAETIVITNTQGNTANAITVTATAGGINIDSVSDIAVDLSGAGANFDVDSAAGSVYLDGGEAAANAIALQATDAAGGIDVDFGTGNMTVTGTGASADFVLDCDLFSIDGTGTSNVTVTANSAGEDFTVTQAGAVDASLILSSAGTAADALQVTATTGGMVLNTGLATGILINTATYEHKIKYFPISQGVVAASEVIVGGGTGLICTSLDAGANEAGGTEGYAAVGDDEDILIWSFPLPDDFVDTGTQADLIIEFDIDEQAIEECNIDVRIFEYDGTANATAIITDTIVAANDGTRAWKGLVTNSAGIGNETDLDQGDHLIIELTATADADDFNIYGFRLTYRAGLQATQ